MIARVWHGWTTPENADVYETLLREEIFPGIEAKGVDGYLGIQLLRRPVEASGGAAMAPASGEPGEPPAPALEIEFTTVMWFDSWEAVREFAGDDHEQAVVPDAARAVLSRFDMTSSHYEVRENRVAGT